MATPERPPERHYVRRPQGIPFFPEEAVDNMLAYGAAHIAESVLSGILEFVEGHNLPALTREDILEFLRRGRGRIEMVFNIREADISDVNVLGAAKVKLAMEKKSFRESNYNPNWLSLLDTGEAAVEWLERITREPPSKF